MPGQALAKAGSNGHASGNGKLALHRLHRVRASSSRRSNKKSASRMSPSAIPALPTPAVIDVSLTVPKGKCVAVVGRNGSGKTTLLALLPRFYDPQQGRILIDGIDVTECDAPLLRSQISIVTQDSVIFPGTIADNIAYGIPLASREDIEAAARRSLRPRLHPGKAAGLRHAPGRTGRPALRRPKAAHLHRPRHPPQSPILILDEATSQVDAESEHLIQQAIEAIMHERTRRSLSPTASARSDSADKIIVMDRGRIVGQGRHESCSAPARPTSSSTSASFSTHQPPTAPSSRQRLPNTLCVF